MLVVLLGDEHALPAVRQEQPQGARVTWLHQLLPVDSAFSRPTGVALLPAAADLENPESQVWNHSEQHHWRCHRLSAQSWTGRSRQGCQV